MEIKDDVIYFGKLEVTLAIESKDGKKLKFYTDHIQMANDLRMLRDSGRDVTATVSRCFVHQEHGKHAEECIKYVNEVTAYFDEHFKKEVA